MESGWWRPFGVLFSPPSAGSGGAWGFCASVGRSWGVASASFALSADVLVYSAWQARLGRACSVSISPSRDPATRGVGGPKYGGAVSSNAAS